MEILNNRYLANALVLGMSCLVLKWVYINFKHMSEKLRDGNRHYTEAFKRHVIEEYLRIGCSKESLLEKYGIKMHSGIQKWMRQLGYRGCQKRRSPIYVF